jgi:hypothetical protein
MNVSMDGCKSKCAAIQNTSHIIADLEFARQQTHVTTVQEHGDVRAVDE